MLVTSISKCFNSMYLSLMFQSNTTCLSEGPPVSDLIVSATLWCPIHMTFLPFAHILPQSWFSMPQPLLELQFALLFSHLSVINFNTLILAYICLILLQTFCIVICLIWNNMGGMYDCLFIAYPWKCTNITCSNISYYLHDIHYFI